MNSSDVNEKCDIFLHTLRSSIETYFPLRKVKFHPSDKPWMTPRIKGVIFDRQQAFHSGNTSRRKKLKQTVVRSIAQAKKQHYSTRVQKLKQSNPSAWFRQIRAITGDVREPMPIHVPGLNCQDDTAVATAINDRFTSIAAVLEPLDLRLLPAYLPAHKPCPTVTPWEVYKALEKVQRTSAGGPDEISARFIRLFSVELATPLAHIINTSFQQGQVPQDWKRAVVSIPKSSPPTIDNLRPNSFTNHFAKVAEGFITKWLLHDAVPKLDPNQFGNRRGLSTNHYLINMLHHIHSNAEKPRSTSSVVFTDFTKAFDRIAHTVAIRNLIDLEVRPSLIHWIADFLSDRQQC